MQFMREILSCDSEQGSFSRLSGLLIIVALIVWSSWGVFATPQGQLVVIPDVPEFWLWLVVSLYGINKVTHAFGGGKGTQGTARTAGTSDEVQEVQQ